MAHYLCSGIPKTIFDIMKRIMIITTIGISLMSCNVTRTITTQSEYFQRGDTTCTIVTKTIETYDASRK